MYAAHVAVLVLASACLASAVVPAGPPYPAAAAPVHHRQTSSGILSSLMPSFSSSAIPLALLAVAGLGAFLVPFVGGTLFFREAASGLHKRGFPAINPAILDTVQDVLERLVRALDQADAKH